jgi:hypothetical protein
MTLKKVNRKIALLLSDSHTWFSLGLCSPDSEIPNLQLNSKQLELWGIYKDGIENTFDLAGKDEVIVFHMGDITHGNKYTEDLLDGGIAPQIIASSTNFYPILDKQNVKILRIAEGTSAHNFGEQSSENLVKYVLKQRYPKKNIDVINHGLMDIAGVKIDFAHHGPPSGSTLWTKGNVARNYLRNYMMMELSLGNKPADLVLRGHFHEYVKEVLSITWQGITYESTLIVMPPLCMIGAFARQATRSQFSIAPGVVAVEIINEQICKTYPFIRQMDVRYRESL